MAKHAEGLTLDLGCGPGGLSRFLNDCIFLDFSRVALKNRWQGHKRRRILASVENIPFKSNVFDTAIASEVIEHTDNPKNFVMEIYRILRRGGTFMFSFPWHDSSRTHKFKRITREMLGKWLIPPFKNYRVPVKIPLRAVVMAVKT